MCSYKELFYNSQAEIATAIENLEDILESLKKCMQECEENIKSENNRIVQINLNQNNE